MIARQRLDLWLWRARFFKTRAAASDAVESGAVRLARVGAVALVRRAGVQIGAGDVLCIANHAGVQIVEVRALCARRGPAAEARSLYRAAEAALDA